ncbi:hypothetical protein Tco_0584310 [Tanacetum coccineum]
MIVELEKTLAKQTKENSDLLIKIDNLENAFADEVKRATMGKLTAFDKDNCDFGSKVTHLEKIIAQKTKDFDDVKLELSNRTAKFEAYFEKLENTKVVLERQLARKVDDSKAKKDQFLKEIIHLRTQLENLKGKSVKTKFDKSSILGKPPQLSKSWFASKVVVQKDLSKPVTAQSLPRNEKDQLLKRIASLGSKLASQDIHSCQKEYHELRTSYNALKVKFDSLNQTKRVKRKKPSTKLKAETMSIHNLSNITKMIFGIEERRHGPNDAMQNPSQPLKIYFRNSDKSKDFLKSSSLWSSQKFYMRKIVSNQGKYEYVGQKLQKINQDGFTAKDDLKRSQRQRQRQIKDKDQYHKSMIEMRPLLHNKTKDNKH